MVALESTSILVFKEGRRKCLCEYDCERYLFYINFISFSIITNNIQEVFKMDLFCPVLQCEDMFLMPFASLSLPLVTSIQMKLNSLGKNMVKE